MIRNGTVRIGDADIYYEVHGTGDPLVLVHGGMASLREWDAIIPLLAGSFQVVAYDRAGIGRSSGTPFQADIISRGSVELASLMGFLGLERAHVFGSCLGGAISLNLAAEAGGRVRSVLTTGVLFYGSEQLRQRLCTSFRPWDGMPRPFHEMSRRVYGGEGAELGYENFRNMYTQGESVGYASAPAYDLRPSLRGVECPVLLVQGDRDPYWGVEQPVSAQQILSDSALWVLPRCGHYPHVQYPRQVAGQAAEFFLQPGR